MRGPADPPQIATVVPSQVVIKGNTSRALTAKAENAGRDWLFMKIWLIYPYFIEQRIHSDEIAAVPMGLYYIGAMLKSHGHAVEILNWHARAGAGTHSQPG